MLTDADGTDLQRFTDVKCRQLPVSAQQLQNALPRRTVLFAFTHRGHASSVSI